MRGDGGGRCCSSLCFLKTFSLLFWVGGVFLCFAGVSLIRMFRNYRYFFQDFYVTLPGILAVGAFTALFFTGVVGLCIRRKESRCQQGTFMYFLIIVLCLEASAAVMGFVYSNRIEYELSTVENIFGRYNGSAVDPDSRAVDQLQKRLGCCGVHNYTDWHAFSASVPESCCIKSFSNCTGDPENLHHTGCQTKLHNKLEQFLTYIFWGTIALICVEFLAALSDCVLMGQQSLQDYRILDSETFA